MKSASSRGNRGHSTLVQPTDLTRQVEALQMREREGRKEGERQVEAAQHLPQQMSFFLVEARATPNYLVRTPLFAAMRPGQRRQRDGEMLVSPQGFEIRFSGEQLD